MTGVIESPRSSCLRGLFQCPFEHSGLIVGEPLLTSGCERMVGAWRAPKTVRMSGRRSLALPLLGRVMARQRERSCQLNPDPRLTRENGLRPTRAAKERGPSPPVSVAAAGAVASETVRVLPPWQQTRNSRTDSAAAGSCTAIHSCNI